MNISTGSSVDKVQKNLAREIKLIKGRTVKGLYAAGLHLKGASQKEAPVVTGNLRNSAWVVASKGQVQGSNAKFTDPTVASAHARSINSNSGAVKASWEPEARVGYSAVYALSVHENPRAGQTGGKSGAGAIYTPGMTEGGNVSTRIVFAEGGKWKFLEDPLKNESRAILKIVKHYTKGR